MINIFKNYIKIISCFFLKIFLSACAADGSVTIAAYGNYCGPGYPETPPSITAISDKNLRKSEEVAFLRNHLSARDQIDAACREHDICYVDNGMHNPDCDLFLVADLAPIIARGSPVCRLVALALVGPFYQTALQRERQLRNRLTSQQISNLQIYASLGLGTAFMSSGLFVERILSGGIHDLDYCGDIGDGSITRYFYPSDNEGLLKFISADQAASFLQFRSLGREFHILPDYFGPIALDNTAWININQDMYPTPIIRTFDPLVSARSRDGSISVRISEVRARRVTSTANGLPLISVLAGDASAALKDSLDPEELQSARLVISDGLNVGTARFARSVAWLPRSQEIVYAVATHWKQPQSSGAVPLVTNIVFRGSAFDFAKNIENIRNVLATLNVPVEPRVIRRAR